ncbi:hypothetical protein [Pseudoalteromonas umbrosa]|uniref:hypothetical protein n=1 Tax=Pseudoalteromonas umbrosa TaxID=3048489 RepID=UPI0024C28AC9|nr:hypothetical protein [Pseudoalteromonas sp. B95]MDK1288617.1 hypothetical protein [Pseudoalteromonas sp. B95]
MSRYIELNLDRANMVSEPVDYSRSSYQHNALGKHIELLTELDVHLSLGLLPQYR